MRHAGGTEVLSPFAATRFVKGPPGPHHVRNDSSATVRLLMLSTLVEPTATAYPDSDKVGIYTGVPGEYVIVRRDEAVDYYDGEMQPEGAG